MQGMIFRDNASSGSFVMAQLRTEKLALRTTLLRMCLTGRALAWPWQVSAVAGRIGWHGSGLGRVSQLTGWLRARSSGRTDFPQRTQSLPSPASRAVRTASVRSATWSLLRMFET